MSLEVPAQFLEQIRSAYPHLQFTEARLNRDGLVNDIVILDGSWVFRFPKNEWARERLRHEALVLELAQKHVELPVPVFELRPDFAAYRLIPGRALFRDDIYSLDESAQNSLAKQLAGFLSQLHAIPAGEAVRLGIEPSDAERSPQDWARMYDRVEKELFPLLMTHQRQWVQRRFTPVLDGSLPMQYTPALIHGDLGQYHLIYDPASNQLNGVIDFGTAGLGDPACDFAAIIDAFGESFLHRIGRFYPGITESLDRARFWAITLELQWALGGLRTEDLSWFTVHIGRGRDIYPYGVQL